MFNRFYNLLFVFVIVAYSIQGQITMTSQSNLAIDTYTRNPVSISLQNGFKYGFVTPSLATNLLNLSIGTNPTFVSSAYVGSALNPGPINCNSLNSIDITKPIGETHGDFAVNSNGAATYNIPITVSPGTNGVEPSISISYNSQAGTGLMGLGWSLSGLSSISRTNWTILHDNLNKSIELQYSDAFALDGSRLFCNNSQYGVNGSTYYTEQESFTNIISNGSQGNGPQWFEVKDKSGRTIEYGRTSDSRHTGVNDNTVLTWMVNKITDEFGNYMTFTYFQFNGELIIKKIEYTGNVSANLAPYNSIEFDYIDLAEKNSYYIGTKEFRNTKLIKKITCFSGTSLFKKYVCDYQWSNMTKLISVTEVNSDNTELHPTKFCWDDADEFYGTSSTDVQTAPLFSNPSDYNHLKATFPADIDGDGFSDVFCYSMSNLGVETFKVMKNDFRNSYATTQNNLITFSQQYSQSFNHGSLNCFQPTVFTHYPSHLLSANTADINHDNKQEIYTIVDEGADYCPGNPLKYNVIKIFHNGTAITQTTLSSTTLNTSYDPDYVPYRFSHEINDYGATSDLDELTVDPENIRLKINLGSSSSLVNYPISTANTIVRSIDFDGDGVGEILILDHHLTNKVNLTVLKLNGSGPFVLNTIYTDIINTPANPVGITGRNMLQNIGLGDFNADGKTDIVYLSEVLDKLFIRYSNGQNWFSASQIPCFTALTNATNYIYDIKVQDINNDNKSDIIITDNQGGTSSPTDNYFSYYSLGDVFLKGPSYKGNFITESKKVSTVWNEDENKYIAKFRDIAVGIKIQADYNGDGVYDVASFNDPNFDKIINNSVFSPKPQIIRSFKTVLGNNITINYGNILREFAGQLVGIYLPGSLPSNPELINLKPNLWVVQSVNITSGGISNVISNKMYQYKNAITHKNGRGFLGFEEISTKDFKTTALSICKNDYNNPPYFIPFNYENIIGIGNTINTVNGIAYFAINTNSILSKETNVYSVVNQNPKSFFIKLDQKITKDYLNSKKTEIVYTYNLAQAGNIQTQTTTYGWGSIILRTENSIFNYILNNGRFKLQTLTSSFTQAGDAAYSRTTDYYYDSQGHLTSTINDPTFGNQSVTTSFSQFNFFGTPTKACISAGDITTRCNETVYDITGRFVIKKTNAIGDFTEIEYEPLYGNVTKKKNTTGLTTQFFYDGLGRLIKTIEPNTAIDKTTYQWDNLPSNYIYNTLQPANLSIYSVKIENEGKPVQKFYYDGAARIYREEAEGLSGTVYIDYLYRHNGNNTWNGLGSAIPNGVLLEKTDPYYNGQIKILTKRNSYYDYYGRIKKEMVYLWNNGNYTYQNIYSQYTYNNFSTESSYNKSTITAQDHLGRSVIKENNSAGQNDITINDNLTQIEKATYLFYSNGNKKQVSLTNNVNTSQNIVTTFAYNNLAQRTQINDPSSGITNSQYNSIGELVQLQDASGTFNYSYDLIGRETTKIGNSSGTTSYLYVTSGPGKGNIDKITGPNSSTEFKYDIFSRVIEFKEIVGSKSFKTTYAYDKYGNNIEYTFPNNFIVKRVFDNKGNLTSITNSNNQNIWQIGSVSATGLINQYSYGNGITTTNNYTDLNLLYEINHGSIHKQAYTINAFTGNIDNRRFTNFVSGNDLYEQFTFDNLDRLKKTQQYTVVGLNLVPSNNINNINYNPIGSIGHKDDAGDYAYSNPSKPYTLTNINNATSNVSFNTLNISYNDFKKVSQINEMTSNKQMNFIYGNDNERIKVDYAVNSINQFTRYYSENYDRQETSTGYKEWNYIFAPSGLCAINYNNNGNNQLLYTLTDNLGSPVLLTNATQVIVEEYSFDAWGRRRNPLDWSYTSVPIPQYLNRGFTFHEHIDEFGLVNMNGRVYDPVVARFIQPDNYIQTPDNLQNFNRYAYCLNNPLKYTDPSGNAFVIDDVIAAVIGGVVNLVSNGYQGTLSGHGFWNGVGRGFAAFGAGAVAGYGAVNPQYGGWIWGGAVLGATNTWLGGGKTTEDYIDGAMMGVFSLAVGAGLGEMLGPVLSVGSGAITQGISNAVLRATVSGALEGGTIGFVSGFALTYMQTGDLGVSLKSGALSMAFSSAAGAAGGAYMSSQTPKTPVESPAPAPYRSLTSDDTPPGWDDFNYPDLENLQMQNTIYEVKTSDIDVVHPKTDLFHDLNLQNLPEKIYFKQIKQLDGNTRYIWQSTNTKAGNYNGNWEIILEPNMQSTNHTFFKKTK